MATPTYIHERPDWPRFRWSEAVVAGELAAVRHRQGRFVGRMEALGFGPRTEAVLRTLTDDVVKSSEIEGEILDLAQVRSSLARRLGVDAGALVPADRQVEGVVEMALDATQHYDRPLTKQRLCDWHAALFPTARKGTTRTEREMRAFLAWFNDGNDVETAPIDPVVKAALAHLWFVTVHPFEDGNGRIARAITDLALARSEGSPQRFYSMSSQIRAERSDYYAILESTQKGDLDVTAWVQWFLACLDRAFDGAERALGGVLGKARFWDTHRGTRLNDRQRAMINRLLDGFEGKLTSSKWAALAKCSQDTALRDIADLVGRGIFVKEKGGGRSTSYALPRPGR